MCLSDDWRHEQIQIIPQILPWAVRFHGIRTLHHYGTYTPLVPCSSTYLISNNPLEVPASSFWTASLFLKVIRAILAFFSHKISFNFCNGYVLSYSVSNYANFLKSVTFTWTQWQELGFSDNAGTMTFCYSDSKDSKATSRIAVCEFWNTIISFYVV